MYVYHFTDTVRAPWIFSSGVLLPSRSTVGGFPDLDFLWATTDSRGTPTATVMSAMEHYKRGIIHLVRFTLYAEDFEPYLDVIGRHPEWNAGHVRILVESAKQLGENPENWRLRETLVDRSRWAAVHTRSYSRPAWIDLPIDAPVVVKGDERGIDLGGRVFFSTQSRIPQTGTVAYKVRVRK